MIILYGFVQDLGKDVFVYVTNFCGRILLSFTYNVTFMIKTKNF